MQFLFPWGLLALTLIPVLVVIHLLRVPGRIKVVSFLPLWDKVLPATSAARTSPRRRFDVLLLLEILIVALLAFALAETATRLASGPSNVALVVDMTASMSARNPDGHTRFDDARALARNFLAQFAPNDRLTLVECFGPQSVERTQLRARDALAKLDSVSPGLLPASGDDLFEQVVLPIAEDYDVAAFITDSLSPTNPSPRPSVLCASVGAPCENLGLTQWSSTSLPDGRVQVFLTLLNSSPRADSGSVRITGPDGTLAETRFAIDPGQSSNLFLDMKPGPSCLWLHTQLSRDAGPDALPLDDSVDALATRLRVLVVGPPSEGIARFFRKVFPQTVVVTELPEGSSIPTDQPLDLVIASGATQVPAGDYAALILDPASPDRTGDVILGPYQPSTEPSRLTPGDDSLLASVDARTIHASRYRLLKPPPTFRPLLWLDNDPVAVVRRTALHRPYVILGLSPDQGWANDPSFVAFMVNLLSEVSPTGHAPDSPFVPLSPGMRIPLGVDANLKPSLLSASESSLPSQSPSVDQSTRLKLPPHAMTVIWHPVTSIIAVLIAVGLFLWWCWPR